MKFKIFMLVMLMISSNSHADEISDAMGLMDYYTENNFSKAGIEKKLHKKGILFSKRTKNNITYWDIHFDDLNDGVAWIGNGGRHISFSASNPNRNSVKINQYFKDFKKRLVKNGYNFVKKKVEKEEDHNLGNNSFHCVSTEYLRKLYVFRKNNNKIELSITNGSDGKCYRNGYFEKKNNSGSNLSLMSTISPN